MDVRQVRYFLAVVKTGTVHAAAARLHVAQPSVSQALRRLERELGSDLFLRTGRRLVLTAAGRALVEPARDLVRALDVAQATVASVEGLHGGRLAVTSMPSQAVHPLPTMIAGFRRAHPGVSVGVATAPGPDEVCDAVCTGAAEVGLLATANGPVLEPDLRVEPLFVQGYVVVARDAADLPAGDGPVELDALRGLDLVVGQHGTGMRRVAEAILSSTDCRIAVQVEQREALLPLVLAGMGVAVVADSWRGLAEEAGLVVRPAATGESLHGALVLPRTSASPAAAAFTRIATR
ncbi:putative transcriptional regulator, LysR family [Pseudonocardia sp. Ae168_Ps1]|uniref:LysR family transcriptional regulator n=1 Tax=unclassified Pseudonocardia TaxID=2619320 RepID=UPI00094AFC3F|nr:MULTISPECIES: LysR family transcriptional regulator [unclassified Pseudonocardia]OLL75551.1 putative transcriptional regulator, LysR family [Pseudonocardia sp. Ae150A_Ps1]OLL81546.1 putative transcriptional regulator, LysR family [Pseudonocardia sp. Ae168_Ps1]OLL84341.1 putative transcriptional regulator, LysR family [Pseudonocardia sp. Ae263_Ps1]OLL95641.1 putative transcriptional regulator, LysR family [Pseudonocardia sp. Ae356_Ps1]